MIRSPLAPREAAALAVAHAAAAFADDASAGSEALALALRLGAPLDVCAHLYAAMGCPALLRSCLDLGASPFSVLSSLRHDSLPAGATILPEGATPMARALLAGSAPCCQALAERGASMLSDPFCAIAAAASADDGVSRWSAVMAGLSDAQLDPGAAQVLAASLLHLAAFSFSGSLRSDSTQPLAALQALDRLAQLGADFSQPMSPSPLALRPSRLPLSASRPPSAGSWLFLNALSGHFGRPTRDPAAISALAGFCSRRDPTHSAWHLRSAMERLGSSPGGGMSALPDTDDQLALRRCCELFARLCHSPLAIMELVDDDLAGVLPPDAHPVARSLRETLCARASRRSIMFLLSSAQAAPALCGADLARAEALLATCLKASAMLWGLSSSAIPRSAHAAHALEWLDWARMDEPNPKAGRQGASWPLMAAKLAAASDPRLAASFGQMAHRASALAQPHSDPGLLSARLLAVDLACQSPLPSAAPRAPSPLRI